MDDVKNGITFNKIIYLYTTSYTSYSILYILENNNLYTLGTANPTTFAISAMYAMFLKNNY